MSLMQCPLGHPPGPQEFCPICGRRATPVAGEGFPDVTPSLGEAPTSSWETVRNDGPNEPPRPAPPQPPAPAGAPLVPPVPASAPPPVPFPPVSPFGAPAPGGLPGPTDDAGGGAAAKARELIAELSHQPGPTDLGGPPPPPAVAPAPPGLPPAPPGAPATPYLSPDSPVPSFGSAPPPRPEGFAPIPSYAPTEPPGLGFPPADQPTADQPPAEAAEYEEPPSPGQWSDGSEPPTPSSPRRARGSSASSVLPARDDSDRAESRSSKVPLLLLLVVLLGGAYLVKTQLLDSSDTTTTAPPVRASVRPTPQPTPSAGVRTLSAAELAAAMTDAHFKHGYDAGKARAGQGAVAAADREQVCRAMALKERASGYPWGAHDRAGCLVALSG